MSKELKCNINLLLDGDPKHHVVCGGAKVSGVASLSPFKHPVKPTKFKVVLEGLVRVHWVGGGEEGDVHYYGYDHLATVEQDFPFQSLPPTILIGDKLDLRFSLEWPPMHKRYGGGLLYPGSTSNVETDNGIFYRLRATLTGAANNKGGRVAVGDFYFADVPQLAGKPPGVHFLTAAPFIAIFPSTIYTLLPPSPSYSAPPQLTHSPPLLPPVYTLLPFNVLYRLPPRSPAPLLALPGVHLAEGCRRPLPGRRRRPAYHGGTDSARSR